MPRKRRAREKPLSKRAVKGKIHTAMKENYSWFADEKKRVPGTKKPRAYTGNSVIKDIVNEVRRS